MRPPPPAAPRADAALVDVCDFARNLVAGWRLRRTLKRAGTPVYGLDRDAPWHKGVRGRRLRALRALHLLDVYASHSLQDASRFADEALYLPNAAWTRHYHLGARTLQELREPSGYRYDVSFIGNVNRQYDDRFAQSGAKIGTSLNIRMPSKYTVRTGATLTAQDHVERSTPLTVSSQYGVDVSFTTVELTMQLDDFSKRIIEPAMAQLAAKIESDALSVAYKSVANYVNASTDGLLTY